ESVFPEGEGPRISLGARARREAATVQLAGELSCAGLGGDEGERRAGVGRPTPGPRDDDRGRNRDGHVDGSNAIVSGIRDEKVAHDVEGDTVGDAQLGAGCGAAIGVETRDAGAGDRADDPGARRDLADAEVALVSDEEVARGVDGDTVRGA